MKKTIYTESTSATYPNQKIYTKKECESEVLHHAYQFVNASCYNRSKRKKKLYLWVKLLENYDKDVK